MSWLLALLVLACGTAPSPEGAGGVAPGGSAGVPGPDGPGPDGVVGGGGPVALPEPALDPGWLADERAFREALAAAAARCRSEVAAGLDPGRAGRENPVLSGEALRAGCGAGWEVYDTWAPRIGGRTRSGDVLLTAASRLADDLDYLERARVDPRDVERRNAVEHLHGALADVDRLMAGTGERPQVWDLGPSTSPQDWLRSVASDQHGVGGLQDHFQRLAFQQGTQRRFLRLRMLEAALRTATRDVEARRAALTSVTELTEDERALREAYQAVAEASVAVYQDVFDRYDGGAIDAYEAMVVQRDRGQAAHDAWKLAWDAEVARLGGLPPR